MLPAVLGHRRTGRRRRRRRGAARGAGRPARDPAASGSRIRPDPLDFPAWAAAVDDSVTLTIPRRAHVIDLTGGAERGLRSKFSKSARRGTRLAETRRRPGGDRPDRRPAGGLLPALPAVGRPLGRAAARAAGAGPVPGPPAGSAEPSCRRWRSTLGKAFAVTLAYVDDQPAFGSITLLGQTAHDTRAAMDKDRVGATCAGDLVQWRTIQLACDLGCTAYHLGESGPSASLAQYKEKFGAEPVDYAELRLERLPYTRADQAAPVAGQEAC